MFWGWFFQFSPKFPKCIFFFRTLVENPKNILRRFFEFPTKFPKSKFFLQKILKFSKKWFFNFFAIFQFSPKFPKSILSLQKYCRKSKIEIFGHFFWFKLALKMQFFNKKIIFLENFLTSPKIYIHALLRPYNASQIQCFKNNVENGLCDCAELCL